jgi:hypothetical protein
VGLVEDQQQATFGLPGLTQDLLKQAILTAAWNFSQLGHQQFQQSRGRQVGQGR